MAKITESNSAKFSENSLKIHTLATSNKDHRVLNYKSELSTSMFSKRFFSQGELQKVEWYSDEALVDQVLQVDIVYIRDSNGVATKRTTTRTWRNTDDTDNALIKTTIKLYNAPEARKEGQRRRANLFDFLMGTILSLKIETQAVDPDNPTQVEKDQYDQEDSDFIQFYQNPISGFIMQSHSAFKDNVSTDTESGHTWLDNVPTSTGGVDSIRDTIVAELTI